MDLAVRRSVMEDKRREPRQYCQTVIGRQKVEAGRVRYELSEYGSKKRN